MGNATLEGSHGFAFDYDMECGCENGHRCKHERHCRLQKYTICEGSKPSILAPKQIVTGHPLTVDYGYPSDKPVARVVLSPYVHGSAPDHTSYGRYTASRPGMVAGGESATLHQGHGSVTLSDLSGLPTGRYEVSLWVQGAKGWEWLVAAPTEILPHELASSEVLLDTSQNVKVEASDRLTTKALGRTPIGGKVLYRGNASCKATDLLQKHGGANVYIRAPQYCGARGANTGFWSACVGVEEGEIGKLACPHEQAVIDHISFASYGLSSGECNGNLKITDSCHAEHSLTTVSKLCVGKRECDLTASAKTFSSCPLGYRPYIGQEDKKCCKDRPDGADARVATAAVRTEYTQYQDYAVEGCELSGVSNSSSFTQCREACTGRTDCHAWQYTYNATLVAGNTICSASQSVYPPGAVPCEQTSNSTGSATACVPAGSLDKEVSEFGDCRTLCSATSGCNDFVWWSQSGLCQLFTDCAVQEKLTFDAAMNGVATSPVARGKPQGAPQRCPTRLTLSPIPRRGIYLQTPARSLPA